MKIKRSSGGAFSRRKITFKKVKKMKENHSYSVFRCVLAFLYEGLSVRPSVGPSVDPSVGLSVGPSVTPENAYFRPLRWMELSWW